MPTGVMIVDGDLAVRQALQFALQVEGWTVFTCATGVELLHHPALHEMGCLVLDHDGRGLDGFAVLAGLRASGATFPVIMMTAHATPRFCRLAALAGVAHVVEKPILDGALVDLVHAIVAREALGQPLRISP